MTEALIFDMDETLINRWATMKKFLSQQYDRFADDLDTSKEVYISGNLQAQNNGYTEKQVAYRSFCESSAEDHQLSLKLYEDYLAYYGSEAILFDGAKETLEAVSTKYTLAMITNGKTLCQNRKIDSTGIRGYFKSIMISEQEGIKKPDEDIFNRCLAKLNLPASQCLFIGDHPENDIIPAHGLGMKTVWIESDKYSKPQECDASLGSISELAAFLGL